MQELSAEIQPQAGGNLVPAAKVILQLWKKGSRDRERVDSGSKRNKITVPVSCLSGWRQILDGVISSTMGCSLCTLRKPEEQYKLLYEVCQVL